MGRRQLEMISDVLRITKQSQVRAEDFAAAAAAVDACHD